MAKSRRKKAGKRRSRRRKAKTVTIRVSKRLGNLHVPGATRAKNVDEVVLQNDFDRAVRWTVPAGVFEGGAVNETIAATGGLSSAKRPVVYEFKIEARYQVQSVGLRRRRRKLAKRRARSSDPIIIIET